MAAPFLGWGLRLHKEGEKLSTNIPCSFPACECHVSADSGSCCIDFPAMMDLALWAEINISLSFVGTYHSGRNTLPICKVFTVSQPGRKGGCYQKGAALQRLAMRSWGNRTSWGRVIRRGPQEPPLGQWEGQREGWGLHSRWVLWDTLQSCSGPLWDTMRLD